MIHDVDRHEKPRPTVSTVGGLFTTVEVIEQEPESLTESYELRLEDSLACNLNSPSHDPKDLNSPRNNYQIRIISPQPTLKKTDPLMSKAPKPQSRTSQIPWSMGDIDETNQVTTLHYGKMTGPLETSLASPQDHNGREGESPVRSFSPNSKLLKHQGSLDSGFLCYMEESPRKEPGNKGEQRILPRNFSSIIYN